MTRWIVVLLLAFISSPAFAQAKPETPEQRDARLQWWREARFGMFIHWGPVSIKGTEIGWSRGAQVPLEEYDNLYKQFNPEKFNADEWVSVAKAAGMRYIVLTTKHHDGFCLWDTKQTDFNIMNSPFKRDVCKELAEACKKQGIRFGTYHSVCDWHHPDFPLTSPGGSKKRPNPNLDRYNEYLLAQVKELITNYGPLGVMWFDVPQMFDKQRGQKLEDAVRALQPDIIINNRSGASGDYDTPEQTIGAFQNTRPWETCMTICRQWAWKPNDEMKSLSQCLQTLVTCAGGDGNLLFNVGPMPTGEIEARQIARLKEMGQWLDKYGQSIYATRGGPFKPTRTFAATRRDKTIYLHVFAMKGETLALPPIARKIVKSTVLTGGTADVKQTAEGINVAIPAASRNDIDTIIALELDGSAMDLEPVGLASSSLASGKKATASNVYQKASQFSPTKALDDNSDTRWATDSGTKSAWIEIDLGKLTQVGSISIDEAYPGRIRKFEVQYKDGSEWRTALAGSAVGAEYHQAFKPVQTQYVRLNILEATEGPTINEIQLFKE